MKSKTKRILSFNLNIAIIMLLGCAGTTKVNTHGDRGKQVLIFTKTMGYRHSSIEPGTQAIQRMGKEQGIVMDATENAADFNAANLAKYDAVLFMNTTGDVLNPTQEAAFKSYIQAGGGFVGVHAATDTEYDWPWYNKLVGAYFLSHPKIQEAEMEVLNVTHPATRGFDKTWVKTEEWYNFKNISPDIDVLIRVDESSYEGGTNGENHPIAWFHNFDGGRSFYTAMGHGAETFQDAKFMQHLFGGIAYAIGE